MMNLRLLNEREVGKVYARWMIKDFPESELKELPLILDSKRKSVYDTLGIFENDCLIGYAFVYTPESGNYVLLDYLGIDPGKRGKGAATQALGMLKSRYQGCADAMLIECERPKAAPDEQMARKRIRFYEKAGAILSTVRILFFGVEYAILVLPCGKVPEQEHFVENVVAYYKNMLPEAYFENEFRLLRG